MKLFTGDKLMKMFFTVALGLSLTTAFAHDKTYWGEKVNVGEGYARSYIVKGHDKEVKEIGIAISEEGLNGLPDEMKEYTLPMPANTEVYPYKHITFDWNPHGHEPMGVYDKPHFDIHFYFITEEERHAISCMDEDTIPCLMQPDADYLVSDYAPTPAGVPMMGWHWVDLLSPEFNGGIFTRTFIYGYYGGETIFIEPMVTIDYLLSKEESTLPIRQPAKFPYDGYYPKNYQVKYDDCMKMYKVVLKDFYEQ
ncbi:hypothetical protein C0V70_06370 [Bacteriovorax stolpii]|uniref:TTHB210-like domain-containing protein n=1 Tax=Bacteriovorax stolpii TaxID=960 RepID=A0A2K9NQF6_BACTC|nr:DUF5602 domain-containing protein [Bacteriovorax stolpii]AUN97741.1 hypothetical protein C0V70_06370 [Bacteriovorax stolpii]